jgi:hypothetical protein
MSYISKLIPAQSFQPPKVVNPFLAEAAKGVGHIATRQRVTSRIQSSAKIAAADKINMLWRRAERYERIAENHKALKMQASNNYSATRSDDFLKAAKEHHAAMIGHQTIANHARSSALNEIVKASASNAHRAKLTITR